MNNTEKNTQHIKDMLRPILGETTIINYFSYYGILKDELMFALYKSQKFYLKLDPKDIPSALTHQGVEYLPSAEINALHKYYVIPDDILEKISDYTSWFKNSIEYTRVQKQTSYYNRKERIRSLPNMNYQLERKLRKIQIYSIEQLFKKGEIDTFVELIKIGEDVNHITLFRLYGAIHHQLIYTLSIEIQKGLLLAADEALYAAGFRKRFTVTKKFLLIY